MSPPLKEGDLVLLLDGRGTRHIVQLSSAASFHSNRGRVDHDSLIGQTAGRQLTTHLGEPFWVLRPSLHDLILDVRRKSQIVYPKESGYILLKLSVRSGSRVVEAGSGSGALTIALAQAVAPDGQVTSYEIREDMLARARANVERLGLEGVVTFKQRDIAEGFEETEADALFLDVRSPHHFLTQAKAALAPGGFLGAVVPTANQVSSLLAGLEKEGFVDLEASEILLRSYKTVPARLRPEDRMVGHTGYLVFGRPLVSMPS
ncbi:MAG: tRNA (adenine-N1)-methyltransferase [Anaerolineae bacterium]